MYTIENIYTVENIVKVIFAAFMSAISYALGGFDAILQALAAVIVLDYMTGLLSAAHQKRLSSRAGFASIMKKLMYMAIVSLANIMDSLLYSGSLLRDASIFFFIANEGLSILENAACIGFPLPAALKDRLEQIKGK